MIMASLGLYLAPFLATIMEELEPRGASGIYAGR
jgi:hypothetical protein